MNASHDTGRFITFEGIDGAGKSTQMEFVCDFLRKKNKNIVITREPGGTPLGEKLRELLLRDTMHRETEALLMFAARREHLEQVIEPALKRGDWVVSDRFTDASFAYQGGGRGLDISKLQTLEAWVHPHIQPDLTLLFDVDPEVAGKRRNAARNPDKFEQEKMDFFTSVRKEYLRRASESPERFKIIDGTYSIKEIQQRLHEIMEKFVI